ncbi:hypothetical protein B0O99DRAFT_125174 [Bisporella sp. PMI_857]|nr:hypothetical protein B0O99DRAFT_125174 [Bisporella sp. PMI_857]
MRGSNFFSPHLSNILTSISLANIVNAYLVDHWKAQYPLYSVANWLVKIVIGCPTFTLSCCDFVPIQLNNTMHM